jgi:hypothetical protein
MQKIEERITPILVVEIQRELRVVWSFQRLVAWKMTTSTDGWPTPSPPLA